MATQTTTQVRQIRQGLWSLVGMTAATVATLGGVVLWQVRPGDGTTAREASPAGAVAVRSAETAGVSDQEMYSRRQAGAVTSAGATMMVYLVNSDEAVADLHARLAALAPVDFQYTVMVLQTAEQGDVMLRRIGESDAIRYELGLPGLEVADLRTP
jgi:hypothetical protein